MTREVVDGSQDTFFFVFRVMTVSNLEPWWIFHITRCFMIGRDWGSTRATLLVRWKARCIARERVQGNASRLTALYTIQGLGQAICQRSTSVHHVTHDFSDLSP